ncbi:MAG: hypothetical protein IJS32_06360 [Kiritimatiellae bacterium]|nr:hypothetical protein [Kiritimatiellia bacterium]
MTKKMWTILAAACVAAMAGPVLPARAAEGLKTGGKSIEADDSATVMTSDKLTFDYRKKFAIFEGSVVVSDPRMQLKSDRLTVVFGDDDKIKTIKAEGKVFITQGDKKARGDVATYDLVTGKIVLVGGPPQVLQGRNIMEAEVITFWRDEQRVECRPRARLVVYSDDFEKSKNPLLAP